MRINVKEIRKRIRGLSRKGDQVLTMRAIITILIIVMLLIVVAIWIGSSSSDAFAWIRKIFG